MLKNLNRIKYMYIKIIFLLLVTLFFSACGNKENKDDDIYIDWFKPSLSATWQWQLTGELNINYNVDIYDIDLFDTPVEVIKEIQGKNKKVICYFSAGSYEEWRNDSSIFASDILGNNLDGWIGEKWLDIRSNKVFEIMNSRLELAKNKGCDGVEPDNVDGYANDTGFSLTYTDQLIYNKKLANRAHELGLSIGLKNDLEQIQDLEEYFDFALNEQCNEYLECELLLPFISNKKPVFNAEYSDVYINDTVKYNDMCNKSNSIKINTLLLPMNLDDSFRKSCLDI